ncbi:NUDIX domain-containing protein [Lacticaseibacillus kribbianus]|uniref:NUDIX domain-containing protein n=1 Tax=Lacticaseibacillus kribbianus TaxID=2926292 RepID=UPI001CD5FEC5|nr:NUDIX domain-containing protein [Lacticaseibacillus kribbianus]
MVQKLTVVLVATPTGIVMINRLRPPYRGLWNGLGGKVEPGETPLDGALREVQEESGIALDPAEAVPAGLVHWHVDGELRGDLYLYYALTATTIAARDTREGLLAPRPLAWLQAPDNLGLVADLKALLPHILAGEDLAYNAWFEGNDFKWLELLGPRA